MTMELGENNGSGEGSGSHEREKDGSALQPSPRSPLSSIDLAMDGAMNASIEQLYNNVCEMESSDDQSPSRASYISYGAESRIDLELRHLVGDVGEVRESKKEIILEKKEESSDSKNGGSLSQKKPGSSPSNGKKLVKINPNSKIPGSRISMRKSPDLGRISVDGDEENPDVGPLFLKQAREMVSSGENLNKALDLALRAVKTFEKRAEGETRGLNLVMSLHILAAIYASLGKYNEAVPVLERSIEIPRIEDGEDQSLAKFAGCMQLGDMYGLMGQIENSLLLYTAGLEIQRQVLGESDARVGETCRYLAEAHVQSMQFEEAARLCQMALDIHKEHGSTTASIEEAADRRLMGLICDAKGDYEVALEHYVLASMAMASQNHRDEVASIDCSIGDAYMSLARFDEAIFAYQKALAVFKQAKGENHSSVASVYVRLADLYNKIGKLRDSKSYCENALRIYMKPSPGTPVEEVASGFIEISAIYQSMNELEQALKLLKRALKIYANAPGQQNTIAGIEAQMGVISYMIGNYPESYTIFKSAISKFRNSGEKKTALFGIALNQMGLSCVQRYAINEAADLFEEAKTILEKECGPHHPDTLAVYSNLAGTYDAMGRLDDAIEILEYVVGTREEKLGTANPEVEDEKQRLATLLKEAGRARSRRNRALLTLLDKNPEISPNCGQRSVY